MSKRERERELLSVIAGERERERKLKLDTENDHRPYIGSLICVDSPVVIVHTI